MSGPHDPSEHTELPDLDVRDLLVEALDSIGDGFVISEGRRILYANDAFCRLTGYSAEELRRLPDALALVVPDDRELLADRGRRRAAGEPVVQHYQTTLLHKSGRRLEVDLGVAMLAAPGAQARSAVIVRDITDRRRMAASLYESELRFRALAESLRAVVFIVQEGRLLYVNPAVEELTGYAREALLGRDPRELLTPAARLDLEAQRDRWERQVRSGTVRLETRLATRSGEERWVDVTLAAIELAERPALVGTAVDITTRHRTEHLLRTIAQGVSATTGEAFFRSVVRHLADALGADYALVGELVEPDGQAVRTLAVYGDGAIAENFTYVLEGTPCENVVGKQLCCYPQGVATRFPHDPLLADLRMESYAGTPLFDSKGEPLGILCVLSRQRLEDPEKARWLLQIFAARTAAELERSRAHAALKRSEESYRSLFEGAVYGIYRSTPEGRFLTVNPALVRMLGYDSAEELLARDIGREIYVDPRDRERLIELGRTRDACTAETRWKKKDGTPITVRLSGRIVRNPRGEIDWYEFFVEDITERQQLEEELAQARKMEAVGRLAGGIAHDFNNLLTVIGGYAELLAHSLEPTDPRRADVGQILDAAKRAALLTRQLLAFGRKQFRQPRVLDLGALVAEMKEALRRVAGDTVEVAIELPPQPVYVEVDREQMEQVLLSLAVNAREAMPQGGCLTVAVSEVEVHTFAGVGMPGLQPGRHALLSVTDTGQGIPPEARSHLFEPFFTTKTRGHLGLGLSTVYGIVQQSHGRIEVESAVGRGSTFRIYLPRVAAPTAAAPPLARTTPVAAGGATTEEPPTILVAEDEPAVRQFIRQTLERAGYTVLEAEDGRAALAVAQSYPGPIHLLLSDVVMPGLDGFELATALRQARPDTKLLFMSGYADRVELPAALGGIASLLQKPFTPDRLRDCVGAALAPEGPISG